MYHELDLYSQNYNAEEFLTHLFAGVRKKVDGYIVPSGYLGKAKDLIPTTSKIICPIDHPNGLSDTKVRQHAILSALKKGANAIDLSINPIMIVDGSTGKFKQDILTCQAICMDHDIDIRIMFEHKKYDHTLLKKILKIIADTGVYWLIPSTGLMLEDYLDSIIMCRWLTMDYNIQAICNPHIWMNSQYDEIIKNQIRYMRLRSVSSLQFLGGV
jgi:deoxyribose-phosphate aldolase